MRLFLVARHGQSLFNVDKVVNGDPALDRGLSEQGIEEAERLAGQIAALPLDLVAVSPLPRALPTAATAPPIVSNAPPCHGEVERTGERAGGRYIPTRGVPPPGIVSREIAGGAASRSAPGPSRSPAVPQVATRRQGRIFSAAISPATN